MSKSRILKSRSQLSWHSPEKPFQAPKIIFKSSKLIDQNSLPYKPLLKEKRLKFTFLKERTVWYIEVHRQRQRKLRKQIFLFNFRPRPARKPNFFSENSVVWKVEAFGLKNWNFPRLLVVAIYPCCRPCCIYYGVVAGMWHLKRSSISFSLTNSKG